MVAGPATVAVSDEQPPEVRLLVDLTATGRATGPYYTLTYTVRVRTERGVAENAVVRLGSEPRSSWTKHPPSCGTVRSRGELHCSLGDIGRKAVDRSASVRVPRSAPPGSAGRSMSVLATADAANAAPRSARVIVTLSRTSISFTQQDTGGRTDASAGPSGPAPEGSTPSTGGPSDASDTPAPKGHTSVPGGSPGGAKPRGAKPSGPKPRGGDPGAGKPSGTKPKPRTPAGTADGPSSSRPGNDDACRGRGTFARDGSCPTKKPSTGGDAKPRTPGGHGGGGSAASGHGSSGAGSVPGSEAPSGGGESCRPGEECGAAQAPSGGAGGPGAGSPPGAEDQDAQGPLPSEPLPSDHQPAEPSEPLPEPLPPEPPSAEPFAPDGAAPPRTAPEQALPSDGGTQMTLMSPTAMSDRDTTDWAIVVGVALVAEIGLLWGIACVALWRRRIALDRAAAAGPEGALT